MAHAQTATATTAPGSSTNGLTIVLLPDITATATFAQGSAANTTVVTITATSLTTPNSGHAAHIHTGTACAVNGPIAYPLNDVIFDANGKGTSTTTVNAALNTINDGNHYVNVHDTTMAAMPPDGGRGIFCGVIPSGATSAPMTSPLGTAVLSDNGNGTTNVKVSVIGLDTDPKYLQHAEHIHSGTCTAEGPVVYPLPELTADAMGMATASATVNAALSTIADGKHYVNVNVRGANDPGGIGYGITCGTVVAAAVPGTTTPGTTVAGTTTAPATATMTVMPTDTVMPIDTAVPATTAALPGFPNTGHGTTGNGSIDASSSVLPLLLLAVALAVVVGAGGVLFARGRASRQ